MDNNPVMLVDPWGLATECTDCPKSLEQSDGSKKKIEDIRQGDQGAGTTHVSEDGSEWEAQLKKDGQGAEWVKTAEGKSWWDTAVELYDEYVPSAEATREFIYRLPQNAIDGPLFVGSATISSVGNGYSEIGNRYFGTNLDTDYKPLRFTYEELVSVESRSSNDPELQKELILATTTTTGGGMGGQVVTNVGKQVVKKVANKVLTKAAKKSAKTVDDVGKTAGGCFVAGTLILAPDSIVFIERIEAGDTVTAFSILGDSLGAKVVVETFARETDRLIYLEAAGDTIWTTPEHPFWTGRQWTPAGYLAKGDSLYLASGDFSAIDSIARVDSSAKVYNFHVEDWHNYFVGSAGVLVHNTCPPPGLPKSNQVRVDIDHIVDRHTVGGKTAKQRSKETNSWFATEDPNVIQEVVKEAYTNHNWRKLTSQELPDGTVRKVYKVRGPSKAGEIEMIVNPKTRTIETAYPRGKSGTYPGQN